MNILTTDVLVVGAGPAGATTALALATYGVKVICINKHSSSATTPRAHIFNQRGMEVLRDFDLERHAMALASPHELMRDQVWCSSLAGPEFGRNEAWSTHPTLQAQHDLASPCDMVDLTQEVLEPILVSEASRRGAKVRFDTELLDFTQDAEGVTANLLDRLSGATYPVRAAYLVGADGGNSRVVELAGLPLEGKYKLGTSLSIGFKADLGRYLQHRPGDMYWMIQHGHGIMGYGIGGLRMVRAWDRWIGTPSLDPDSPKTFTHAELTALIHRLLGDDSIPVEVQYTTLWTMNQIHATRLRAGRVFCIGDAVHRHPPMNGLGSNTALQDAHNLAWKLAFALQRGAGDALLESFDAERQPVAEALVKKAMGNMALFPRIATSLGLTPTAQTKEEIAGLLAEFESPGEAGMARRAAFRDALPGLAYGFSAVGGEFNLHYASTAVIPDGLVLTVDDPELEVILGLQSGRRLPHVWLTEHGKRVSSLDLCGRGIFTLLTGSAGHAWQEAAAHVAEKLGLPIVVHPVGPRHRFQDAYGEFGRRLPNETGAILVRPDHFVAWHVDKAPRHPEAELTRILSSVLDLTPR